MLAFMTSSHSAFGSGVLNLANASSHSLGVRIDQQEHILLLKILLLMEGAE